MLLIQFHNSQQLLISIKLSMNYNIDYIKWHFMITLNNANSIYFVKKIHHWKN